MLGKHLKELVAILLIGEGVIALLFPKQHVLLWEIGPQAYKDCLSEFARQPNRTRCLAALEVIAGICLAMRQFEK